MAAAIDVVKIRVVDAGTSRVVTFSGEKLHEAPDGNPEQLNETASSNPFTGVTAIVMYAPNQKPHLQYAYDNQTEGESPRPPVVEVLQDGGVVLGDGDLQRRADRYSGWLLLFILCTVFPPIWIGGYGLYYASDKRRWWGWLLLALALLMALTDVLSGGLRALPWDWHKRLCEPNKCYYCEYRQTFPHDGGNVPYETVVGVVSLEF